MRVEGKAFENLEELDRRQKPPLFANSPSVRAPGSTFVYDLNNVFLKGIFTRLDIQMNSLRSQKRERPLQLYQTYSEGNRMKDPIHTANFLILLIAINTSIFLILSLLHFYWAFGGTLWLADVLPTNSTGSNRMNPGVMATLIVSFGLLLLAVITTGNQGVWDKQIDRKYFGYGAILISMIFFARAIGDFKFIGFFKTIKGTRFAVNDTQFFSPLCIFIAVVSLLIFALNKTKG